MHFVFNLSLTFCEIDPEFCRASSEEMRMAAEVERFRNDQTIRLNQISRDKLLNEYCEQLLPESLQSQI